MKAISRGQVWTQKDGWVAVRIEYFCSSFCCPTLERSHRSYGKAHVHVTGWHRSTLAKTNHDVMEVTNLYERWEL